MRAVTASAGELRLVCIDDPQPRPGEALVRIAAAGVNFLDVSMRRNGARRLGMEGAGAVEWIDPADAHGFAPGDRVAWAMYPGAYAELAAVPARRLVPVPAAVSLETAAGVLLQGLTANYLTTDSYAVLPGDAILVHAAAGGVGGLVTGLCAAKGARVFGTASSDDRAEVARRAGAQATFPYADFCAAVRDLTGGEGVHAVFDSVNRDTFHGSLRALRPRGTLVVFGETSGRVDPIDPKLLQEHGSLTLTYPGLAHFIGDREESLARAEQVFTAVAGGLLRPRVTAYPFSDADRAHRDLEERRSTGKLLLKP